MRNTKATIIVLLVTFLFLIVRIHVPRYIRIRTGKKRVTHLLDACKRYYRQEKDNIIRSKRWSRVTTSMRPRLYYSDNSKLIVCEVPKCASTEWRKLLLLMENDLNVSTPDEIEHSQSFTEARRHRFLWEKFSEGEDQAEIDFRINKYYRIMTVREPIQRVVSAYMDKMIFTVAGANEFYANMSRDIHKKYAAYPQDRGKASFGEFVRHILNTSLSSNLDIHWRPYNDICDPCAMKYHYIVKLETFDSDASYLVEKLGVNKNLLPKKNRWEPADVWPEKYLKHLPELTIDEAQRLYEYYKLDYEFFYYPRPPILQKAEK